MPADLGLRLGEDTVLSALLRAEWQYTRLFSLTLLCLSYASAANRPCGGMVSIFMAHIILM